MDLLLNVVLLWAAFVAALAGVGGDTWRKDSELAFRRRITARGWIAIVCWLLALVLGVAKEYRTIEAAREASVVASTVQADLRERLGAANASLEAAKRDILLQQDRTNQMVTHITLAMLDLQTATVYRQFNSFRLGLMWYWLGSFPEAIYHFQAELKRNPHHVPSRYNLGVVLAAAGRHNEAKAQFQHLMIRSLGSKDQIVRRWLAHMEQGTPIENRDWVLWRLP
jgi:tetratricopeptide (TPR) repeat protein